MDQRNKIRGSLVGGAVGDALGYTVEFWSEGRIFETYGEKGITQYTRSSETGLAVISDDTQMTLFTVAALLCGTQELRHDTLQAYLGWLHTQGESYREDNRIPEEFCGSALLRNIPELYVLRAPGMTCLQGLAQRQRQLENGLCISDFIANPINNSKGCGGIMRVAPLGLAGAFADIESAQNAAITHSHSLGYMSASVLTHILSRLVNCDTQPDLKAIVLEARDSVAELFVGDPFIGELTDLIDRAVELSGNSKSDLENIHALGQGWVAEEALAIPLYCSLKYRNDFSKAVIASVNHQGDSDSTGAITGNIMGALLGYSSIEPKWTEKLELHDLIIQLADQLYEKFHL